MKLHLMKDGRVSLNGTRAELRALRDRLDALLKQMDAHELAIQQGRHPADDRPLGEHYVDFGLDEVDAIEEAT